MMNILFNAMPTAVSVNGIEFELNTDFRVWLQVGELLEEMNTAEDKNAVFFDICEITVKEYPEKGYVLGDELLEGLCQFYKGFPGVEDKSKKKKTTKKDFDFKYDAGFIYCSFASFYKIRLQTIKYMHWWEFLTLFEGLMMSDQTSVNFVVGTRQQEIKSKMPKEEKERIQKLKKQFALPKSENDRQAENNLTNWLMSVGKDGNGTGNNAEY